MPLDYFFTSFLASTAGIATMVSIDMQSIRLTDILKAAF